MGRFGRNLRFQFWQLVVFLRISRNAREEVGWAGPVAGDFKHRPRM